MRTDEEQLKAEWARAQGMGRSLALRRAVATLAGVGVAAGVVAIGLLVFSPALLAALPLGWGVRKVLWPRGQFA
jgi:putative exporter of polyketide antibiotics